VDVIVLTAICALGLGLAGAIALRWGSLRTERRPRLDEAEAPTQVLRRFLRTASLGMVAGAVAGILVLGFGGRLAMRILAATSGDHVQGLLTDAEERVGEITVGGTVGLILFVGLLGGIAGGLVYVAVRRWLPERAWVAGLLYGVLIMGLARADPLDPDNTDFDILRPVWLAIVLFAVLFPLFGVVLGALAARLDRAYPTISARPGALAAHAPLLVLALAPPLLVALAAAAGVAVAASRVRPLARTWPTPGVDRVGQAVLVLAGGAGLAWLGAGVATIV
jgi:hypothetical protein